MTQARSSHELDIPNLPFDSERDCSSLDVVQDIKIERFDNGASITQHDGGGDCTHCVFVPNHAIKAVIAALSVATDHRVTVISGVEGEQG